MQEVTLKGPACHIEAYSCNLHFMDPVEDGLQVACMTTGDWQQAPAGRPHPGSGDCKDAGWDLGPVPVQAD